MQYYYVNKSDLANVIQSITAKQQRQNLFVNIQVMPYAGKKYEKECVTVKVG